MNEKARWEFVKERSLTDNLECLSQGLRMLAFSLENLADPALDDRSYELRIHPYTLLLHLEAAKSMASEAIKMVDFSVDARRASPGKLVPLDPINRTDAEEEGDEEEAKA